MKRVIAAFFVVILSTSASGQDEVGEDPGPWDAGFNPTVQEYEVVRGDTLWGISARIVGDPFLWPKVWSLNPEITNPHWIYPGDRVRFYPPDIDLPSQSELIAGEIQIRESPAEELAQMEPPPEEAIDRVEIVDTAPERRAPLINRRFLARFITDKELQEAGTLTNAVPDKILLSNGDTVFLEFPASKRPAKGEQLLTFRTRGEVYHPENGSFRGHITQITGLLKVTSRKEDRVTRALVVDNLHELERGQHAIPFDENLSIRLVTVPAAKDVKGTVMAVSDGDTLISGAGDLVYIDRGKRDGLVRGNQLMVYGRGDGFTDDEDPEDYTYWLGVVQVLDTQEKSSTCLVLQSRQEIERGAMVRTLLQARGG